MADNILSVSQQGIDVKGAKGKQLLFSSQYPFEKLDTQNAISFQNVSIFFNSDPPSTDGATVKTLVYQFAHSYSYVPRVWVMYQNQGSSGGATGFTYGYEDTLVKSVSAFSYVQLHIEVDKTNINTYVLKTYDSSHGDPQPNIGAYTLLLRYYVFVDDIGIT